MENGSGGENKKKITRASYLYSLETIKNNSICLSHTAGYMLSYLENNNFTLSNKFVEYKTMWFHFWNTLRLLAHEFINHRSLLLAYVVKKLSSLY